MSEVLTACRPEAARTAVTHHVKVAVVDTAGGRQVFVEHPGRPGRMIVGKDDRVTWEFRNYTADDLDLGVANFRDIDSGPAAAEAHPFRAEDRLGVRVERNGGQGRFSARAVGGDARGRYYTYDVVAWTTFQSGSEVEIRA